MGDGDEREVGGKIREFLQLPPRLPTQAGPGFKSRNKTKPDLALWVKEWLILGDLTLVHKMVCRSENMHGRGKDS